MGAVDHQFADSYRLRHALRLVHVAAQAGQAAIWRVV